VLLLLKSIYWIAYSYFIFLRPGFFVFFGTDFTDYTVVFLCSGIRDSESALRNVPPGAGVKTLRFTWTLSPKGHFFIFGTDFTDYTDVFLCSGIRDSVFAYGYAATRPNRRCEMSRQGLG
jgi:hypothetical protein